MLSAPATVDDILIPIGLLEDEAVLLDEAALQLATLDHPDTDFAPYRNILDTMTERLATIGRGAQSGSDQAAALVRVIAGDYGFDGDSRTYDDPANADLIRVIDRRRGLPVALAIVYVSQARRLGWDIDVLNTPGHVLVRLGQETTPILIDPFDHGSAVGPERLHAILRSALGPDATPTSEHVAALSNRGILVRLIMNQAVRAERDGDDERALTLYRRMTIISPGLPHGWWERTRLELAAGDRDAARGSLGAMLEITRDPALRTHVFAALDAIAQI
jgi:regulator of sirC expression with transglutaminase-like and TPR domain